MNLLMAAYPLPSWMVAKEARGRILNYHLEDRLDCRVSCWDRCQDPRHGLIVFFWLWWKEEEEEKCGAFLSWFKKVASDKYKKLKEWLKEMWMNVEWMNWSVVYRKESIDMIKSIVVMRLFILSTIQGSWFVPPPTLPTPWIDGNSDLWMAGYKHAAGLLIGFLWRKSLSQWGKSIRVSLIIWANFCWIKIPN